MYQKILNSILTKYTMITKMGYYITYEGKLEIHPRNFKGALNRLNHLHSDEMLNLYARGGNLGPIPDGVDVRNYKWYSWVNNPTTPYKTLKEAFHNWSIFENYVQMYIDEDTQHFVVRGEYDNKWGQQDFLIEQMAPFLEPTVITAKGEDGFKFVWMVENGEFSRYEYRDTVSDDVREIGTPKESWYSDENMSIAM